MWRVHRRLGLLERGSGGLVSRPRRQQQSSASSVTTTNPKEPPQTLVERIAQRHALGLAPGQRVRQGDCISIRPRHVLTHDNSWAVMAKFAGLCPTSGTTAAAAAGGPPPPPGPGLDVADPRQPVLALDHNVQDRSSRTLARYASIARFARRHGLDFYPAGRGIGHQVGAVLCGALSAARCDACRAQSPPAGRPLFG